MSTQKANSYPMPPAPTSLELEIGRRALLLVKAKRTRTGIDAARAAYAEVCSRRDAIRVSETQ